MAPLHSRCLVLLLLLLPPVWGYLNIFISHHEVMKLMGKSCLEALSLCHILSSNTVPFDSIIIAAIVRAATPLPRPTDMINCRRAKCDGANSFFLDRKNKQPKTVVERGERKRGAGHVAVINSSKIIVDHDDKEGEEAGGAGEAGQPQKLRENTTKQIQQHKSISCLSHPRPVPAPWPPC